jgi:hypothetical protein
MGMHTTEKSSGSCRRIFFILSVYWKKKGTSCCPGISMFGQLLENSGRTVLDGFVQPFDDLASAVIAAFETYAVIERRFSTNRIQVIGLLLQFEMGTSFVPSGLGNFPFWMRHVYLPLKLCC